jgi:hypothetical protein
MARFSASTLDGLKLELEREFEQAPTQPAPLYACLTADLPAAADFINCAAYVSDIPIIAVSDGTDWRRQDTGAAI